MCGCIQYVLPIPNGTACGLVRCEYRLHSVSMNGAITVFFIFTANYAVFRFLTGFSYLAS